MAEEDAALSALCNPQNLTLPLIDDARFCAALDSFRARETPSDSQWILPAFAIDAAHALRSFLCDFGFEPSFDGYEPLASTSKSTLEEQSGVISDAQLQALRTPASTSALLDNLAVIALHPAATASVALRFRPLIVDIAARWLVVIGISEDGVDGSASTPQQVLAVLCAIARLMEPVAELYPHFLALTRHSLVKGDPFQLLDTSSPPVELPVSACPPPLASSVDSETDDIFSHPHLVPLLLALHRLLTCAPWLPLSSMLSAWAMPPAKLLACMKRHPLVSVRLLAWRVVRKWTGAFGMNGEQLYRQWVCAPTEDPGSVPFPSPHFSGQDAIEYESLPSGGQARLSLDGQHRVELRRSPADVWILPVLEERRLERWRDLPVPRACEASQLDSSAHTILTANIGGVLLLKDSVFSATTLRASATIAHEHAFVETESALHTMRRLARQLAHRTPTLLSSPNAAGKASLLRHVHRLACGAHAHAPVVINMADRSLDAKALTGSLSSDPSNPGQFIFVEGALTRALRSGRWLILEDLDRAAEDVLVLIAELAQRIQSRIRDFPGCTGGFGGAGKDSIGISVGEDFVSAAEGFMLLATRSTDSTLPATFFGSHHWSDTRLSSPSRQEAYHILSTRFPRIAFAKHLVDSWFAVQEAASASGSATRLIGFRDLVVWARRVDAILPTDIVIVAPADNQLLQDQIVAEACDVFLGSLPPTASKELDAISAALAESFQLSNERAEIALKASRADILLPTNGSTTVRIGRVSFPARRASVTATKEVAQRPFAYTRQATALLERVAVCVNTAEPVLLVGETGGGKTTSVSQLASILGRPLVSLNLSNQTEASDLLGGFKPVNQGLESKRSAYELVERFNELFGQAFSLSRNADFVQSVRTAANKARWSRLVALFREAARLALDRLAPPSPGREDEAASPRKRRKTVVPGSEKLVAPWNDLLLQVDAFDFRHAQSPSASRASFAYVEGPLVRALRSGHWLLLDEVNLATSETLEALSTLLSAPDASLVLTERGDIEPVPRHADFRLFACMNPATDVGKRDLPAALRSCFTEMYVASPDSDREALLAIVDGYLAGVAVGDRPLIADVADFYAAVKTLAASAQLADGLNQPPHYSMRTLSRALVFAVDMHQSLGLRRAVVDGLLMTFTMSLAAKSAVLIYALLERHICSNKRLEHILGQPTSRPRAIAVSSLVQIDRYWLARGPLEPETPADYVITPSVSAKLHDLARVVLTRKLPVLIQGPTSSGKTSIIEYLARRTGHRFVRLNNHEHTDIQEYLGTYASDPQTGKLVYQEGLLVRALRNGDWIVLDELNLAPSDVLEALNRLLDDNRELLIPETQEVVRPHPHFMLFATQNPPGLYAGRKVLSRAFRNRFLELHFGDVPEDELKQILAERCRIAPSYAERIVRVFLELRRRRQSGRVFDERHAFATLRDLFRWGGREAVGLQQLAEDGYMLLAERARTEEDKAVVKAAIEEVMRVRIDEKSLYAKPQLHAEASAGLVWTPALCRLFHLVRSALQHQEPVLLVGETGCGKTSVCQMIAQESDSALFTVNCHQGTDAADLLGGQRPIRDRASTQASLRRDIVEMLPNAPSDTGFDDLVLMLEKAQLGDHAQELLRRARHATALFDWHDGPLVSAMGQGAVFLLDEISLADDSVLERLNSILEPSRTLTLAEKGVIDAASTRIVADAGFRFLATMNPGGDFGKKELSPALRNRFTEIWVPTVSDDAEVVEILRVRLGTKAEWAEKLLVFRSWAFDNAAASSLSVTLRTLLAWADFLRESRLPAPESFVHGGLMSVVDAIGDASSHATVMRQRCLEQLMQIGGELVQLDASVFEVNVNVETLAIGPFSIARGTHVEASPVFSLGAPTTRQNAARVLRAMQLRKPILLEGSPGVGKTTLVAAIASRAGRRLQRINLSDQSDLSDLFGNDLPVEGGSAGAFAWRNAAFLTAMENGDWVLLDEMNLAPQPVLEGLNSCLDHRGEVFIPELGRTFTRHADFRIFAAQNPLHQGGSRKGLPRSFVDRFTTVYMTQLNADDLRIVCREIAPAAPATLIDNMVEINDRVEKLAMSHTSFAKEGAPWEFNLRDLLRWLDLLSSPTGLEIYPTSALEHFTMLYQQCFRSAADRQIVAALCAEVLQTSAPSVSPSVCLVNADVVQVGRTLWAREGSLSPQAPRRAQMPAFTAMESLSTVLGKGWLAILVDSTRCGASSLVRTLASATGRCLSTVSLSSQSDVMDLLGGFEQVGMPQRSNRARKRLQSAIKARLNASTYENVGEASIEALRSALRQLRSDSADLERVTKLLSADAELASMAAAVKTPTLQLHRFEWIDGPLLRAMQSGDWLLIENANLCSSSVLDRLNSLCEPNGSIALHERGELDTGDIPIIRPHPTFRLILSMDPRHGELSRAMRNRGVELYLDASTPSLEVDLEDPDLRRLASHPALRQSMTAATAHLLLSCPPTSSGLLARLSTAHSDLALSHFGQLLADQKMAQAVRLSQETLQVLARARQPAEDLITSQTLQPLQLTLSPHLVHSAFDAALVMRAAMLDKFAALFCTSLHLSDASSPQDEDTLQLAAISGIVQSLHAMLLDTLAHCRVSSTTECLFILDVADVLEHLFHLSTQTPFDFSSAQQMLAQLQSRSSSMPDFTIAVNKLSGLLRTQDGKVMTHLWRRFLPPSASYPADETVRVKLMTALRNCWSTCPHDLKLLACEVLASLAAAGDHARLQEATLDFAQSLTAQLDALPPATNEHAKPAWQLAALINDLAERKADSALLIAHRTALSIRGSSGPSASVLRQISPAGVQAFDVAARNDLFCSLAFSDGVAPADLLRPAQLRQVVSFCHLARMATISAHAATQAQLLDTAKALFLSNAVTRRPRQIDLIDRLQEQMVDVRDSGCFSALASSKLQILSTVVDVKGDPGDLQSLVHLMQTELANEAPRPSIQRLLSLELGQSMSQKQLGEAFVRLGQLLWAAFVPAVPLDPAVGQQAVRSFLLRCKDFHLDMLALHAVTLSPLRGGNDNLRARMLLANVERKQHQLAELGAPAVARDTQPLKLRAIFAELHDAGATLFDDVALSELLARLSDGSPGQVEEQVATIYASARTFKQRLETLYSAEYEDLLLPVFVAIAMLVIGLDIALHAQLSASLSERDRSLLDLLPSLVAFPPVVSARAAAAAHLPISLKRNDAQVLAPAKSPLLRIVGHLVQRTNSGAVQDTLQRLQPCFDQLYQMWAIDRRRAEDAAELAGREYRTRRGLHTENGLDDEQADEEDFRQLFPDATTEEDEATSVRAADILLNADDLALLVKAHSQLFKADNASLAGDMSAIIDHIANRALDKLYTSLSEHIDERAGSFALAQLSRGISTSTGEAPDFYRAANVAEMERILPIVEHLAARLDALVEEWPEQMILRHLLERCHAMLALPVTAPLPRALAHLESFLTAVDDWEAVASREVSLLVHREAIIGVIVSWRRLELASWPALLAYESSRFVEQVAEWWPRFYEAAVRGPQAFAAAHAEGAHAYLRELVSLLGAFLGGSPTGQFAARLQLAEDFARHTGALWTLSGDGNETARHASHILTNLCAFYHRHSATVRQQLDSERATIAKDIRNIAKLASWKDVNVHALKQSAQKSHRALHKCVKAWRKVLQKPASDLFGDVSHAARTTSIALPSGELSVIETELARSNAGATAPLDRLQQTLSRFSAVCAASVTVSKVLHCRGDLIEDLSNNIISTADALSKESLPTGDDRDRLFKALLTRKKRSWADLLKELRRIGLSAHPSTTLSESLQDSAHIYKDALALPLEGAPAGVLADVDAHFFRLMGVLPRLRAALGSHHDDISPRDLSRALGHVESCLALALDHRRLLIESIASANRLTSTLTRLSALVSTHQSLEPRHDWPALLNKLQSTAYHLKHAMSEILQRAPRDAQLAGQSAPDTTAMASLVEHYSVLQEDVTTLSTILAAQATCGFALDCECSTARSIVTRLSVACATLRDASKKQPSLHYLVAPTAAWLAAELEDLSRLDAPPIATQPAGAPPPLLLSSLLVVAQGLSDENAELETGVDALADADLSTTGRKLSQRHQKLHLPQVCGAATDFVRSLSTLSPHEARTASAQCFAFLERYHETVQSHISAHAAWTRSLFRLCFVVVSVSLTLAEKGFCKPVDMERGDAKATSGDGEPSEGTGMGSGQGQTDVSKEIEGEEQLEGLAGEQDDVDMNDGDAQSGEKGESGRDDAFDVENDFAGGKEEDAGSQSDAQESGDEEDADVEDQVGDADPLDPSAVDEKFWAGEEPQSKEGRAEEQMATEAQEPSNDAPEMTAGGEESNKSKTNEVPEQSAATRPADDENAPAMVDGMLDQVDAKEGESLEDLPNDVDLDEADAQSDQLSKVADDMSEDGQEGEDGPATPSNQPANDAEDEASIDDADAQPIQDTPAPDTDMQIDGSSAAMQQGEDGESGGQGSAETEAEKQSTQADGEQRSTERQMDGAMGQSESAAESAGRQGIEQAAATISTGEGAQGESVTQEDISQSLGDATASWQRRLDEIMAANPEQREAQEQLNAEAEVEHVEDDQAHESQALGPASEEQSRLVSQQALDASRDVEYPVEDELTATDAAARSLEPMIVDVVQAPLPDYDQGAIVSASTANKEDRMNVDDAHKTREELIEEPDQDLPEDRAVEQELVRWQTGAENALDPAAVWRLYTSLSQAACFRLTEQLRLILTPTQATRLQGDYRSGKRLNMKRIIPYVASDFTKDKIWLRRTRPSARQYQILLALDDSKSMSDSHSIHLAFQALTLVSGALARLEAGEVSVVRFGAEVDVVVPFTTSALQDETSGAELVRRFTFAQRKTDLVRLLEQSLAQMAEARASQRSSSSNTELWQLLVIISDGLCQDQDRLRALLRTAYQSRVMVVFIVVDSLHQHAYPAGTSGAATENSILSMKSVSYVQSTNGKLEMRVERYMDSFPFEYYVVLRDADALPDTLSSLLRQFFERVSAAS